VIADYVVTEAMLRYFIKKGTAGKISFGRPDVLVSVPAGSTSVEKRYVLDAARQAGAGKAYLIEEPMAAAIGAQLPISGPSGNMIVNIGGGTAEIAVISMSDIVVAKSHRVGGNRFDEAIALYIRRKYNLMIGDRTAEQVKVEIGSALALEEEFFERRDEIESERQAIADLIARKVRARKPVITDKPNAPETLTISERKERDAQLEAELALLDHERLADPKAIRMRADLRTSLGRSIEAGRIGEIADRLEEYDAASAAWGDDPADPMRLPIDERLALFRRFCDDPKLRSATTMLGRLRNRAAGAHRALMPAAPARIAGVRLGNDLSRLLPAETALAAEPLLASEFERRYAESELATYQIEERGEPERGPVVVCLDESSSMEGEREIAAKGAALAVLQIAADDGREGALVEFADAEHLRVTRWAPPGPSARPPSSTRCTATS
jgi:hypothetical protein